MLGEKDQPQQLRYLLGARKVSAEKHNKQKTRASASHEWSK